MRRRFFAAMFAVLVLIALLPSAATAADRSERVAAEETPDDEWFKTLWGLKNTGQTVKGVEGKNDADIDADQAWSISVGDRSGPVVAVVDTGVAYDHPDLAPNMWTNEGESGEKRTNGLDDDNNGFVDDYRGWDFVSDDNDPRDYQFHGTHVAGTIGAAGDNGLGVVGVNWETSIMPVRVLGKNRGKTLKQLDDGVVEGFRYAVNNGADVVNGSLGFSASSSDPVVDRLRSVIAGATDTLFVFSAGNDGKNNDNPVGNYPCKLSVEFANVLCVAATNNKDELDAGYSNFGSVSVNLAAPGTDIQSTYPAYESLFFEDFSQPLSGRWTVEDTWGLETIEGDVELSDSPRTGYLPSTFSHATGPPLDLRGRSGCNVRFKLRLDLGSGDALSLRVHQGELYHEFTFDSSANSAKAVEYTAGLPELDAVADDSKNAVRVEFQLRSNDDPSVGDGARIDDVLMRCVGGNYAGAYDYLDGTSMATPHVSGVAALLLARAPYLTPNELATAITLGVDKRDSLKGKVSSGGRLNAYKSMLRVVGSWIDCTEVIEGGLTLAASFTCHVEDTLGHPISNVNVDAENMDGANDPDDDASGGRRSTADFSCEEKTDEFGNCTVLVPAGEGQPGEAEICFWIDGDPLGNELEDDFNIAGSVNDGSGCAKERLNEAELNDKTDRGSMTWLSSPDCLMSQGGSANGRIAFSTSTGGGPAQLFTMTESGGDKQKASRTSEDARHLSDPSWSPDGSRLIYSAAVGNNSEIMDTWADASDGPRTLVNHASTNNGPVYVPNDVRCGFVWTSSRDGDAELYYSYPGGATKKLTDNDYNDAAPSVSADGKYVVYHSNSDGDYDIYRLEISPDGDPVGSPTNLTQETGATHTDLAPDYALAVDKITYQSNEHGDMDIFVLDIGSGTRLHVTTDVADESVPTFSPDGTKIAFVRGFDIYVQEAREGVAATNITNSSAADNSPDWGPAP